MSQGVVIKRILGTSGVILPVFRFVSVFRYASKNNFPSKPPRKELTKSQDLTHTTVMVQDRLDIQEVPTIVRKVKTTDVVGSCASKNEPNVPVPMKRIASRRPVAGDQAVIDSLHKCYDLKELYNVISILPDSEMSSNIVLCALERIIEVENNVAFRNMLQSSSDNEIKITRSNILDKLIHFVILNSDHTVLLESLAILSRDVVGAENAVYKEKLINETLIRTSDRKFSVQQMCEIVHLLSVLKCELVPGILDELWSGFIDRGKEINENNMGDVFRILPYLKESQKMVYNMLTRKCDEIWWRLPSSTVLEILSSLQQLQFQSSQTLSFLARNINANINTLSEDDLLQIISSFSSCNYVDDNLEGIVEKYVKTKGHKIKNIQLMITLMEYCVKFRLRFTSALEVCANFLVSHISHLSPVYFKSLLMPLSYFHYLPSNAVTFWKAIEDFMLDKFIQFKPEDIVDTALMCVYLEKYPLNLTKKILNPYFLDRMHTCRSGVELQQIRTKLKIFDSAMSFECPYYEGPLLPRDYAAKALPQDARLKRIGRAAYEATADVVGSCDRISSSVLLPQLPAADLYVVDLLLHPAGVMASLPNFISPADKDLFIAILIHPPEHFCSQELHLIGPQVMKKRHLKHLGVSVVDLKYSEMLRMKGRKNGLHNYISGKIEQREKPML